MSILIRDMEMQKICEDCPFFDYEQGYCFADVLERNAGEVGHIRKPDWCPLVEVVLCKDCKYMKRRGEWDYEISSEFYCIPPNMDCEQIDGTDAWWLEVEPNGFCKWGERREDEIH